jgi:hypothetical protein
MVQLRAGAAVADITPPLNESGGKIVGRFVPVAPTNIHDKLHARCVVLDDGTTRLALVVCDLLGIHRGVSDATRNQVEQELKIPAQNVLICATHTHSATSALGKDRFAVEQELDEYQKLVVQQIVNVVRQAEMQLRPAEFAFATADAPEHVFNRRWYMKPGTVPPNPFDGIDQVKTNPPAGNANLLEPAGPTDPTISILSLRDPNGCPIAVFASYSLHYVGGNPDSDISADYYGMFCRELEQKIGPSNQDPPFIAILANGTSGDINNIDFRQKRTRKAQYQQMESVAKDVAAKVQVALTDATYDGNVKLAARYRELPVAARQPTAAQLAWARSTLKEQTDDTGGKDLPSIYAERVLALANQPDTISLPLQVLQIGKVCIGTMPCEVFCETGLEFKATSPLRPALLISLAHGYFGYLPTPRHHRLGGYETWLGTNRLEPHASEKMLEALVKMAEDQ